MSATTVAEADLDPESQSFSGDVSVVQEVAVWGSRPTWYWDFWRATSWDLNYRSVYDGTSRLNEALIEFDPTPDNFGERELAVRWELWSAVNAINLLDPTKEQAALIYLDQSGRVQTGIISTGTANSATFSVDGIVDRTSIIAMVHSHTSTLPGSDHYKFPSA